MGHPVMASRVDIADTCNLEGFCILVIGDGHIPERILISLL